MYALIRQISSVNVLTLLRKNLLTFFFQLWQCDNCETRVITIKQKYKKIWQYQHKVDTQTTQSTKMTIFRCFLNESNITQHFGIIFFVTLFLPCMLLLGEYVSVCHHCDHHETQRIQCVPKIDLKIQNLCYWCQILNNKPTCRGWVHHKKPGQHHR